MIVTIVNSFATIPIIMVHAGTLLPLIVANISVVIMMVIMMILGYCYPACKENRNRRYSADFANDVHCVSQHTKIHIICKMLHLIQSNELC